MSLGVVTTDFVDTHASPSNSLALAKSEAVVPVTW